MNTENTIMRNRIDFSLRAIVELTGGEGEAAITCILGVTEFEILDKENGLVIKIPKGLPLTDGQTVNEIYIRERPGGLRALEFWRRERDSEPCCIEQYPMICPDDLPKAFLNTTGLAPCHVRTDGS